MNHPFVLSWINPNLCAKCNRDKIAHSDDASCEACNYKGKGCDILNDILLCPDCRDKENKVVDKLLDRNREVKKLESIETREQFFNARTNSIIELKAQIDADESIPEDNKQYHLARLVKEHVETMRDALFVLDEQRTKLSNEMRADIVFLNQRASELSSKQREELKIKDINYQPTSKPISSIKIPVVKLSKTEKIVESYAKMMKISIEQARHLIAKNIESAAKK